MQIIPPKSAIALVVKKGETLRVTDVEGEQIADLVCFNLEDHSEYVSMSHTRVNNQTLRITTGHDLFSNKLNVMFKITADTVGVHDILYSPCNRFVYEEIFKVGPQNGCLENLAAALEPYKISKAYIPDTFNIFMHTQVDENYNLSIHKPLSKKGDYIDLEAQMDCLVGITSCAEDVSDANGGKCTPMQVDVLPAK
ncbi:MAG TPA: urea carboxylase-associated family protein [Firmicutes bacterium]|nr:urea carboxylase-associated family protein [Bacillota bacterium]